MTSVFYALFLFFYFYSHVHFSSSELNFCYAIVLQDLPSSIVSPPKSVYELGTTKSMSNSLSLDTQNQLYSHQLPMNTELSNQIMSMLAPYSQSPLLFPMPMETCNYNYTLQQKLQATKQKLKRNNSKEKLESKRSTSNKADKSDTNRLTNGRSKKNTGNKSGGEIKNAKNFKSVHGVKTTKIPKSDRLELGKSSNEKKPKELKLFPCPDPVVEINKLPSANNACNSFSEEFTPIAGPSQNSKSIEMSYEKPNEILTAQQAIASTGSVSVSKVKLPVAAKMAGSRKSVYIDLDCAAEQARLKSSILQNKSPEKKNTAPVSLNPAMLLSSCPGLSITPIVNEMSVLHPTQNTSTTMPPPSNNFNFKQLQHLGNSLTITKTEKNGSKKSSPELILLD